MSKSPIYNEDTPTKPGLYLGLFYGRRDPKEQLETGAVMDLVKWLHVITIMKPNES